MSPLRILLPAAWIGVLVTAALFAQTAVTLTPTAVPATGQAGVTMINLTGSGFPAGTIPPANTDVKMEPAAGGAAVMVKATAVTTIVGTTRRVTFQIPSSTDLTAPAAYRISISGTTTTGIAFASSNTSSLTINPAARISSVNPSSSQAGQILPVTIEAQYSNFVQGATQAGFGAGISVGDAAEGGFGPVTVTGPTTATAQLRINASAAAGPRTVAIRTGAQQASLNAGFTVTGAPAITSVVPNSGTQGQTLSVAITGANTHFVQGVTQVSFGADVNVTQVTVTSSTSLTAQMSIASPAATGPRTITVTTGSEIVTLNNAFTVVAGVPVLTSIDPNTGRQGEVVPVTINAQFTSFVAGVTQAGFGAGISVGGGPAGGFGPVNVTGATSATAQLSIGATAAADPRTITVRTGAQEVSLPDGFTVLASAGPLITDFNPKSGPTGTLIDVIGNNLAPAAGIPEVTLNQQGGGTIAAPVSSFTASSLAFVIPAGAASGPITITVDGRSAASTVPLAVTPSSTFTLAAAPAAADLIQGQDVAYKITLSGSSGFSQRAALSLAGLPAGLTATFKPAQITAGQTSLLTIMAPAGQPAGSATLSVTASAAVDGLAVNESVPLTLNVNAATTSLIGRTVVDDTLQTPLAGVTVKMLGKNGEGGTTPCSGSAVSDAAGNFALTNLGPECVGPQLVGYDGLTVTSPEGKYAGVNLVYTLQAGQVTVSPVLVHLPRIDDKETFLVTQNSSQDQTYSYQSIPGLSVTVYRGTTFTLEDGSRPDPFPLVAVQVPVDRLPDAKPPVPTMLSAFIVAFQPANAVASKPAAVFYPNTLNTPPGVSMTMMTLDPTRGRMVPYGTATVSPGGSQIIPDLDPAFPGSRYGIVNFDWHGPMPPPPPPPQTPDAPNQTNPNRDNGGCDGSDGACSHNQNITGCMCNAASFVNENSAAGRPVDFSSGLETVIHRDIALSGLRGNINITRYYRTLSTFAGPFGIGTHHNYGYRLDTTNPQAAQVINLVTPDGNRFPFTKERILFPAGVPLPPADHLLNFTAPAMRGAVMTVNPGEVRLRWKDGTVYRFVQPNAQFTPQLESIIDPNGNRFTIARNPGNLNQITQVTDPVGRSLVLTYDGASRITSITDPIGRVVRYAYNAQGTLATVTDPEGGITRYEYDAFNRLTKETDARGVVVAQNIYDANGRVAQQIQADGGLLRFDYTLMNPTTPASPILATTVTDPLGRQKTYRFNPAGFLTDVGTLVAVRKISRDPGTNQIQAAETNATCVNCGSTQYTHDVNGNILTQTDSLGNTTTFTYEPNFNKVASIRNALGDTTTFKYDSRGNLLTQTDANGNTTSYEYGAFGLLAAITDALGHKTRFEYDSFGNLIKLTDALGNSTQFRYDGISHQTEVGDSLGRTTQTAYDKLGRIVSQTDGSGQVTTFTYDPNGNLLALRDARGNTTSFTYDAMNRLKTRTDPLGKTDARTYDLNGNLIAFTDRRAQTSTFTYDELNRLTGEVYEDGSQVSRSYDADGHLELVAESTGGVPVMVFPFEYDREGRQVKAGGPFGTVVYQRDELGRVKTRQVVGQPAVTYTYDRAGNLLNAVMPTASVSYVYDALNRPAQLNRLNGVSTQHNFDAVGRVLSITHSRGATVLNNQVYAYDAAGSRTSQQTNVAQPLITQPAATVYDTTNRLLQRGPITYVYDDNGNLVSESGPSGTTTYSWDSRNRLKSIVSINGQTTFMYDFSGNLISQRDVGSSLKLTRHFILDEISNVVHSRSSDGKDWSVLTGRSIDSHIAVADSGGQPKYSLYDAINSTIALVDQAGSLNEQIFYEPFGQSPSVNKSPFLFTGRIAVSQNIYYYRARFYSTTTSRFISEDPLFADGLSPYSYVRNNPVGGVDPTGLWTFDDVTSRLFGIADAVGGYQIAAYGVVLAAGGGVTAAVVGSVLIAYGGYQFATGLAQAVAGDSFEAPTVINTPTNLLLDLSVSLWISLKSPVTLPWMLLRHLDDLSDLHALYDSFRWQWEQLWARICRR